MWHNLWLKFKGVLTKMGLINSVQSVANVSNLLIESDFYQKITEWQLLYQGRPEWGGNEEWTSPSERIRRRKKMSLSMPKVISKKMANLVFNSKANIVITDKTDVAEDDNADQSEPSKFVHDVLNDNYFYNNFERYLEYMFAEGGMVMRFYVADGKVKIRFATADSFFPISQDENGITECAITSQFSKQGKYYTLVELHTEDDSNYIIENRLFESDSETDELGTEVPLSTIYGNSLKDKAYYPKSVYSMPTFLYAKPNLANNFDLNSPLGVSIYGNAVDTLAELDQTYDMLMQELKMGRRRIVVPEWMIEKNPDPKTNERRIRVNFDEQVYLPYYSEENDGMGTPQKPEDITMPLRTQELIDAINSLLDILAAQTGFSAGTFSYRNDGSNAAMETATGVISRNSDTYQSKNSHETILEDVIKKMVTVILELGSAAGLYHGSTDVDVSVDFDDSIAQDRNDTATYYQTMNGGKPLMPMKEAIKRANNLTDSEADEWLNQINDEDSQGSMDDILDNKGEQDETTALGN